MFYYIHRYFELLKEMKTEGDCCSCDSKRKNAVAPTPLESKNENIELKEKEKPLGENKDIAYKSEIL